MDGDGKKPGADGVETGMISNDMSSQRACGIPVGCAALQSAGK